MTRADIVALGAFFSIVVFGLIGQSIRQILHQRAAPRIKTRVGQVRDMHSPAGHNTDDQPRFELLTGRHRIGNQPVVLAMIANWRERVRTVAGPNGMRTIVVFVSMTTLTGWLVSGFATHSVLWRMLIVLAIALQSLRFVNRWLIARFRQRFLATFPDTLELIIRAVRAGIPVVQAICAAGVESEEPVRTTFHEMGDALLVGAELKDVLERAADRLQVADFSYFTVCLILQRETGGNLGDTLDNLASIVRSRRDIRAKSRALTAEGRLSSKMIASIPFCILAFLYLANRPYLELLTKTHPGHKMLAIATVLMVIGLWMINKIANFDTTR